MGELYHVRLTPHPEPTTPHTRQVRALLMLKLGRPREARAAVDAGLKASPTHAPLYRVLGAMQDVAGDVEAARASFQEGLRLNPGYAQLYHAFARLEGKLANWGALAELNDRYAPSPIVAVRPLASHGALGPCATLPLYLLYRRHSPHGRRIESCHCRAKAAFPVPESPNGSLNDESAFRSTE